MKSWLKWLLGVEALEREVDKLRSDLLDAELKIQLLRAEFGR